MKLTKILIFCIIILQVAASQSRLVGQKRDIMIDNYINELKHKIFRDDVQNSVVPPYVKKRNRRMKSIYKSMHENDAPHLPHFGHIQYHKYLQKNEIPDTEMLTELLHKSMGKIRSDHKFGKHHSHKIKKLRAGMPLPGIMQKKFKL